MRPTLEARALKESLLQYLSTTYALSDEGARAALHSFLGDEESGMFRGPYLRIRTPFRAADESWRGSLEWMPGEWTPYAHQTDAFARLSSAYGHTPEPTLITTGTGSGKTEAFLYPVLDHCLRERAAGNEGVKTVLLYPMNALATDQADRLNKLLTTDTSLEKLSAGLYIGDRAATRYEKVLTNRFEMQMSPPDILITNYKMLDLLLQREADAQLWRDADIRYVVVDEFHTYDGAQGTDVAMLLRRLASSVGASRPGAPLGPICPIATSATLSSGTEGDDPDALLTVATEVFGTTFTPDAIIGENRQNTEDFIPSANLKLLPLPAPEELAALADPAGSDEALADLVEKVTGTRELDPFALGRTLKCHVITRAVMLSLEGEVKTNAEVLELLWRHGASSWGETIARRPEVAASALARFVALMSMARDPESSADDPRPLVHVEVHQWARSVSRLLRGVLSWPKAEFRWDSADVSDVSGVDGERTAPATTATAGQTANLFLPAVYCRDCGRSGWAVLSPESDDLEIQLDTRKIRRASASHDKIRVRNLIAATDEQARAGSATEPVPVSARTGKSKKNQLQGPGGVLMVLDGVHARLRPPNPGTDFNEHGDPELAAHDSAFVLVHLGDTANTAAREDWCPACSERNAIRYLGTGPAALAAASITQLFTGGELAEQPRERKTLMFNDSVQDAAHRAGFVANRSYTFSLRALLVDHLAQHEPTALNDLIADVVAATTDPETLAAVVPPDLHDVRGVRRLLSGAARGGDRKTWQLIGERLAFETLMEFGFRSRNGRTLELTRTAAAHVRIPDPKSALELVKSAHLDAAHGLDPAEQADDRYLAFLRVFLERVRSRGAVKHRWLDNYIGEVGTSRYFIWGRRPRGMRAFPKNIAAPVFLLSQSKEKSEFDFATGRLSWYERWAQRCLEMPREHVPEFWNRLLPELHNAGLLSARTPKDSSLRVYGLQPGGIDAALLDDEQVNEAYVRCKVCFWEQTVHPSLLDQWHGQPCPSYRCANGMLVTGDRSREMDAYQRDRDYRQDYYRHLYRSAGTYQVITAEHTSILTRPERESVEEAFKNPKGFNDPNVLSCTPTLEMGIDIGLLSTVVLASLPRTPANYVQRVGRAGRRDGNAFLLTIPERSRRDLYFLEQPKEMIAGRIAPPGCHLSAVEILRRQYLAHLLDLAARGRLRSGSDDVLRPLPPSVSDLFGPSGYLADLVEVALSQGESLASGFLELFPAGLDEHAAADLRAFATEGLRGAVERSAQEWRERLDILNERIRAIDEAQVELHESDPEHAQQKAELGAERRGLANKIRDMGETPAQNALCDLGLLPNYALVDSRTTLDTTLYRPAGDDSSAGKQADPPRYRQYDRPQRYALEEFAPGNTFYANGYRHEVTGLEIGTKEHRSWQTWRVCPGCGYVRTLDAENDRAPCPRCRSAQIADDGSCLFNVIQPTLVTSRDKLEDARIRDDRDERDHRSYEVVHAVDMPDEDIEPDSWRHDELAFGVDFSRTALIRTINVGPARFDVRANDDFAGHRVRLNPFHVCTGCGAATADGKPVFDHDIDELGSSTAARNPKLKHHRPWCPVRRGKNKGNEPLPVLLAHELRTEALRVLLPAATFLVREKVNSFRAAVRLGVDRHFGGDPQHLKTTLASMPDASTGERRWYLVLFDELPGGTGYLHRLKKEEEFRDTLLAAYQAIWNCGCVSEGKQACHRCLRHYVPESDQDEVSRRNATELLESLLFREKGWVTTKVPTTGRIGLDRQLESDLEFRFLEALRDWARDSRDAAFDEEGRDSGHLRITEGPEVVHWRLVAQERLGGTRTDFTFIRADGPAQSIKVYLDGRRYHATPEHNRVGDDARKRTRLRADGQVVFQITWDDLDLFERGQSRVDPVWPPYSGSAQEGAKDAYERYGGNRAYFADIVFANPIDTLLAYLRDPSPERWARRARALVTGLMSTPDTHPVISTDRREELLRSLRAALNASDAASTGRSGPVHVFRTSDIHGLPLVFAVDGANPENLRWTALAVLDDTSDALGTEEHKRRWWAWLYWSNLLQFLSRSSGDGVQLTSGQAADFPVEVLAVCGGVGELDSLLSAPVADISQSSTAPVIDSPADAESKRMVRDRVWDEEILPILNEDGEEPELAALAATLADQGKLAPEFGYELGTSKWTADFAWNRSGVKIAVVPPCHGADDQEAERRDAAYVAAGWTVRTAGDWLADLDQLLELLPEALSDTEESTR